MNTTELPPDPWQALGVDRSADKTAIRTAYRKLVLKCHPDKIQDATLKAQKQDEFQKVQQAYELLNDDAELAKWEEKVKLAEMKEAAMAAMRSRNIANISVSRTPPRASHTHSFFAEVHTVDREPRFRHASPHPSPVPPGAKVYANMYSSKSHDDDVSHRSQAAYEEDRDRRARRAASYEQPSRREDDKREERKRREAKERREDEEREREREKEQRIREKERLKQDRREREKVRDKEKRRDVEDKSSRRAKDAYVEEYHDRDIRDVYPPTTAKAEKKKGSKMDEPREKSSSRRVRDESPPPVKHQYHMEAAAAYILNKKVGAPKGAPPSLGRSQTFQDPPTYNRVPVPEVPPPSRAAYVDEETIRRSSARSRRPSYDTGARSQEKLYSPSQKKSREEMETVDISSRADRVASSRAAERVVPMLQKSHTMPTQKVAPPPIVPESPPRRPPRQNTDQEVYTRPAPPAMPGISRAQTFASGEKMDRYASIPVIRGEVETSGDEGYEDDRRRHRSRRQRSPEPMKTTRRYRHKDGMVTPIEGLYDADPYDHYDHDRRGSSRRHGSYREEPEYYYDSPPASQFQKVKTSRSIRPEDVKYSTTAYTPTQSNWASVF